MKKLIVLHPKSRFAGRLRELRQGAGLSQEALARKAKVDRTFVSRCERGLVNLSLESIYKLARALGVPAHELLKSRTPPAL